MASGLPESTPLEGNSVPRGAAEKPSTDLRRPCGPDPGSATALLAHAYGDALAPLLVASPGSGPPGSPNLSPRFSAAPLEHELEPGRSDVDLELQSDDRRARRPPTDPMHRPPAGPPQHSVHHLLLNTSVPR